MDGTRRELAVVEREIQKIIQPIKAGVPPLSRCIPVLVVLQTSGRRSGLLSVDLRDL